MFLAKAVHMVQFLTTPMHIMQCTMRLLAIPVPGMPIFVHSAWIDVNCAQVPVPLRLKVRRKNADSMLGVQLLMHTLCRLLPYPSNSPNAWQQCQPHLAHSCCGTATVVKHLAHSRRAKPRSPGTLATCHISTMPCLLPWYPGIMPHQRDSPPARHPGVILYQLQPVTSLRQHTRFPSARPQQCPNRQRYGTCNTPTQCTAWPTVCAVTRHL